MAGFRTFANNDLLTAADVNGFLMRQVVAQVEDEAERNAIPLPDQGMLVHRRDTAWIEQYYAIYNAVNNPGGAAVAGWYPVAGAMPRAHVRRNVAQALPANSTTVVQFAAADIVQMRNITFSDATDLFTVPVAGLYRIRGTVTFAASSSATRALYIGVNGSYVRGAIAVNSQIETRTVETVMVLPAGATVWLGAISTTAGTIFISGGNYDTEINIEYMGAP